MALKKNAVIVGGGTSKFGVRQAHLLDMIQEAARACQEDILDPRCAGSNSAIIVAKGLVESGIAEVVLVTGAEKVYMPQRWETNYTQLMVNDHDWDSAMGLGGAAASISTAATVRSVL